MPQVTCRLHDGSTNFVLHGSSAQVLIVDVHASVLLSQKFTNPTANALSPAYTFGMTSGAAVYAFEMIRGDGSTVQGVVKGTEQAKKDYDEAVAEGKKASLGREETADVFTIKFGNVLPAETVTINLHFIQPLLDDEKKDQIKYIFPRTYAQRYGQAPSADAAQAATGEQPFQMDVVVQQAGAIKSISCPSGHPISVELGYPEGIATDQAAGSESHHARVVLKDGSGSLTQDVVLVIAATDLDSPRCFVEPHPSPNHDTTAMALTFVPRFKLPDVRGGMEYIFLVDRSGSMRGSNITLVKEALVVLLRGLPSENTSFNLFSFGNKTTKLWDTSRPYTQASLDEATEHVDSMQADYGGTEIAAALKEVYSSLSAPLTRPAAVFLLTDGSAWDVPTCVKNTQNAMENLVHRENPSSFLRVFTVGIGDGASSDTCDSIARAGHGIAVYVKQGEEMVGKCARLVRAARTPPVNIEVLWTDNQVHVKDKQRDVDVVSDEFDMVEDAAEAKTELAGVQSSPVNLFDTTADSDAHDCSTGPPPAIDPKLPPPLPIQQAPLVHPGLFPGTRIQIYAIVDSSELPKSGVLPTSISIRGSIATTGDSVELEVPVMKLIQPSPSSTPSPETNPILHILAAKALIVDRQDGKHAFSLSIAASFANDGALKEAYLKKDIVRLGTTYGLSSKHTSFVAVDNREQQLLSISPSPTGHAGRARRDVLKGLHKKVARAKPSGPTSRDFASTQVGVPNTSSTLVASASPPQARSQTSELASAVTNSQHEVLANFFQSRLSSAERPSQTSDRITDTRSNTDSIPPASTISSSNQPDSAPSEPDASLMTSGQRIAAIARLQQFDGSFVLSVNLIELLGIRKVDVRVIEEKLAAVGLSANMAATVIAWVWMERKDSDETLDMKEKAEDWVRSKVVDRDVEDVKRDVLTIVDVP